MGLAGPGTCLGMGLEGIISKDAVATSYFLGDLGAAFKVFGCFCLFRLFLFSFFSESMAV